MLMCLAAALVGVALFLRKQSLIGESLSHAAYPGVMVGILACGAFSCDSDDWTSPLLILTFAFLFALLGVYLIGFLERRCNMRSDSALCFILASFFGIGITLASQVQVLMPGLYRQAQSYLYGQAATMTDIYIAIYGSLSLVVLLAVVYFYKELKIITFDRQYARSLGIPVHKIDGLLFVLIALAVVIGVRSVGVVLMSAMLIAPAAAARQFTNRLSIMFILASVLGMTSGFLGNVLSVEWTASLTQEDPRIRLILPTGPMIVMVAAFFCVAALLFAPERGMVLRLVRSLRFRIQCISENILKAVWRFGPNQEASFKKITQFQSGSSLLLGWVVLNLVRNGWLERTSQKKYRLTQEGSIRAARIVRLHRLWELYLVDYLGMGAERVHRSAEEMEHILTPELEQELTVLLNDPKRDPHHQPIPP